jgi:hypothetical protein
MAPDGGAVRSLGWSVALPESPAWYERCYSDVRLIKDGPMSITEAPETTAFTLPQWSAAEFLDMAYSDGLLLRALICRLTPRKWQWSVMSIDGERGELIGIGTEGSLAEARAAAASELDKCMRDPLV